MNVCIISKKECWQDENGRWFSSGGFPAQMTAISSLFAETSMLVVQVPPRDGGSPLPAQATVIPLQKPKGEDTSRKLSVILNLWRYLSQMIPYIRKADVVHTPLPGDISILGYLTAIAMRKRLIARYGSSWQENSQTTMMNRLVKQSMRWFAGGPNVMLATGRGEQPPAPQVHWMFTTALTSQEINEFKPNLDRGLALPPTIVYIGRLSSEKGVKFLIQAMDQIRENGKIELPVVKIVGDGPERSSLEELTRSLHLEDAITFLGQVSREQLFQYLDQADFCVQPSLTEASSKAWLDAMACGLPVIASPVGDAAHVVGKDGERGWLSPPGEPDQLAENIERVVLSTNDWPALRARCRAYVETLTLENWADQIAEICFRQWKVNPKESRQGV
jgi:glycosyltransferase involved in cell wall biosynthesis